MEKIDKKIAETKKRILVAIAIALVALIFEVGFLVLLGEAIKNANPLRLVLGVLTFGLVGALITCELIWLTDYIIARLTALRNYIYVATHVVSDIDFVGNMERKEDGHDEIETTRGK